MPGLFLNLASNAADGLGTAGKATELIAAHGVYALLAIFLFYLWRRSLNDFKGAPAENRDKLWGEHRGVVKATYILMGIAVPVWMFATFAWPFLYRPKTVLWGSVSNLLQLRANPRPGSVYYVDEGIAPEQHEVKFYTRSQLDQGDSPVVTLEWALVEDGQYTEVPFIFSHRYKETRTPAIQTDPSTPPSDQPVDILQRRRFVVRLAQWAAISADPFDCRYQPDPTDQDRKVGTIRCFQKGHSQDLKMEEVAEAPPVRERPGAAGSWMDWFRIPSVYAQSAQVQKVGPVTDIYLDLMGSSDLNLQLQARKALQENLARGNGWDSIRKALDNPASGLDHTLLIHNLAAVVMELPKGVSAPPDVRLKLAKAVYQAGDFKNSATLFNTLGDGDLKSDTVTYYYRGVANLQTGNYKAASVDIKKYMDAAPDEKTKAVARRTLVIANEKAK